jgi:tetratricopeptide (TPR) repeat protein
MELIMSKLKKYFSLAIVFLGAINLDRASLAQFPPAFPYVSPPVPSHDIMFPRRNRSVDQNQGSDPTPRFRQSTPTQQNTNSRQRPDPKSRASENLLGKQGYNQLLRGDFKDAAQSLTMAIRLQPNLAEAYQWRGSAYYGLGDLQSALRDFNQAIRLKPNLAEAYVGRGFAYYGLGDLQSALRDSNQAIRLKPNLVEPYVSRGSAYYGLGDLQSALRDFNQAIRLKPNLAQVYDNRAFLFYDQGNVVSAIGDWKKALSLDSRLAEPYMALAVASYKQGDNDDARTLRTKSLQIDRRYGDLQYLKREGHWSSIILRDTSAFFQSQPLASQSNSSSYQSTQRFANTKTQSEEITGVGLQFSQEKKNKKLVVVSTVDGTPAANAGILPKDTITQIDGLSTQGMTVEQAVKLIKGTVGTDVTLMMLRNGQPLKFRLTRTQFTIQVKRNDP